MVVLATEDLALQTVLQGELEGAGFTVVWALNGHEAYEQCLRAEASCLLLDANVQIIEAFELCQILRGDPDVSDAFPIVLLSDDEVNPRKLAHAEVTELFPKTHAAADLRELLCRVLPGGVD